MVVSILDTVTSIISGMVIFSVLGAMAHDLGPETSIEDVVASGKKQIIICKQLLYTMKFSLLKETK